MNILFFSPFSSIWEHSVPESFIANHLATAGHKISYVFCGAAFPEYCHAREARGISINDSQEIKIKACLDCEKVKNKISSPNIDLYNLNTLFLSAEKTKVNALEAVADPLNYKVEGIPFGQNILYDTILRFKKQNSILESEAEKEYFQTLFDNAFKSYIALKELLKSQKFDAALIYSPQYSTNHVVAQYLEQNQIPVYFLEAGTNIPKRLKTMRCWKWSSNLLVNPLLKNWRISETFDFNAQDIKWVGEHYRSLLSGKSYMVYSQKRDADWSFDKYYPEAKTKKVILATMSSFDEAYAAYIAGLFPKQKAESDVFLNQVEWIKALIEYCRTKLDYFLIVRVHPRDFPNKREGLTSDQGKRLLQIFEDLPSNVKINWPHENISIYDLYEYADVVTTGWSITALEAGMLGIQIVTYDSNLPSYPPNMMLTGRSKDEYFRNLENASQIGWSFQQVEYSFRWLAFNHNYGAVQISNNFDNYEATRKPFKYKVFDKILSALGMEAQTSFRMIKNNIPTNDGLNRIQYLIENTKDNLIDAFQERYHGNRNQIKISIKDELSKLYFTLYPSKANDQNISKLKLNIQRFLNAPEKDTFFNRN